MKNRIIAEKIFAFKKKRVFLIQDPFRTDRRFTAGTTKNKIARFTRHRASDPKIKRNGTKDKITLKKSPIPGISLIRKKKPRITQKKIYIKRGGRAT